VQAQLADLPVELQVVPVQKIERFLGSQMSVARQVAGPDGLAVVWLELSPGDPVFVYVADTRHNRVLAAASTGTARSGTWRRWGSSSGRRCRPCSRASR
jgi:hypothetical protein